MSMPSSFRSVLAVMISLSLSACQSAGFFLVNLPSRIPPNPVHSTHSYGPQPWQKLDVYRPHNVSGPAPVLMFIYGGGWTDGERWQYRFVANRFTQRGFVVVIADYAKYPRQTHPGYVEDLALASRWLVDNIADHGGDLKALHLAGHSAGAHIGAMLLANRSFLAAHDLKPDIYQSFIGLAGPYSFTPKEAPYTEVFGPPERYDEMKVDRFVNGTEPPMLLLHGADDDVVGEFNLERLAAAIRQHDGQVETKIYPELGHIGIMSALSGLWPHTAPVTEDMVRFMRGEQ